MSIHTANTQGQSDPYISIRLVLDQSSQIHQSTELELKEELFFLCLMKLLTCKNYFYFYFYFYLFIFVSSFVSGAHKRLDSAYLQICVKDRGIMGQGIFLGEAYLPLQEVEEENMDKPLKDLPQIQLPLTRPLDHGKQGELN